MSYSNKALLISALVAFVEARFGQEQVPVSAVSALSNLGNPGEAATLAGGIPGSLLAAADPCAKLTLADKIVTALGNTNDVISAARGLVAAEQNFNPFTVSIPSICGDASLPATQELRGVIPLVDPAVVGSDAENAASKTSLTNPFDATGLSVADVMKAQGFSNFTVKGQAAGGNANTGNTNNAGNNNNNANTGNANNNNNNNNANTGNNQNTGNANTNTGCSGGASGNAGNASNNNTANAGNQNNNNNANTGNNNSQNQNNGNANTGNANNGNTGAATGAADFGKCTPTMDFQLGRAGRKADEGTFLPTDPLVAQGQQDALNPNIITNRICDQLTNVCEANDAAKAKCLDAKAQVLASGDKSAAVATTFNSLLGF